MNQDIMACPLRILVAEDLDAPRKALLKLLHLRFPYASIDEARCLADARAFILHAYAQDRPYDIAVLDLKLPEDVGGIPSIDTSLAELIIDRFGPRTTRLVQWTGFPEESAIPEFEKKNRIPQSGIIFEVISKVKSDWGKKIKTFINRLIAEKTVGRWLDDPYFKQMRDRSLVVTSRPGVARSPVDIPAYIHALISVWPALESHRKLEALATFQDTEWELTESEEGVKLTDARSAQALTDAEENARIFTKLTESSIEDE